MIGKILIVDDQTSIRSGMYRALHSYCDFHGEITAVESGKKALDAISSGLYDICFLDLNLPDLNGLDLMERIHAMSPKTRVVIMTAETLDDEIKEKIGGGAFLFIPKPIDLDTVKAFIDKEVTSGGDYVYTKEDNEDKDINEKRETERKPDARTISYSLSVFRAWELKSTMNADTIDISAGGIGMMTSHRLHPGTVLRFGGSLGNRSGIVKWSVANERGCRAGIKFI